VRSSTAVTTGVWNHIAAVKTASTIAIYVNGMHEATTALEPFTDTHLVNLKLGAYAPDFGEGAFFHGRMDEAQIYNRALSAAEIQDFINQPPTAGAGGQYSVDEGGAVVVTASGSDPEDGPLTFAWDLDNNGNFETPGQSVTFSAAGLDGLSSHTITVQVTDSGGLSAIAQAAVNVLNVAPLVTAALSAASASCGSNNATINIAFTDPGTDTHTANIAWGDGSAPEHLGAVTSPFMVQHTYNHAGIYNATATVTDDDGGAGSDASNAVTVNFAIVGAESCPRSIRRG
jgi:hypothetical protein